MRTIKDKLTKQQQEDLFIKLARAIASLNNPTEGAEFLKDLLSEPEVFMLARRLQIAELLTEGLTHEQIREELKVGFNTIAKVQTWLTLYGTGYRAVIKKTNKHVKSHDDSMRPFAKLKRKYPLYFWPQLVLDELVKSASKREKQRLTKVVQQLRDKTRLSKQLMKLL